MIICGANSTRVGTELLHQGCPTCGKQLTVTISVYQRYAHLFRVPFIPIGKTGRSQCDHCKDLLNDQQMPGSLKKAYGKVKSRYKAPWWTYTGLALICVAIAGGIISERAENHKNAAMITAPETGDILEIRVAGGSYTLYKVQKIVGDSAYILLNQYETNKISGLHTIRGKGASAFLQTPVGFTKKDLKLLFDKGMILDIER